MAGPCDFREREHIGKQISRVRHHRKAAGRAVLSTSNLIKQSKVAAEGAQGSPAQTPDCPVQCTCRVQVFYTGLLSSHLGEAVRQASKFTKKF